MAAWSSFNTLWPPPTKNIILTFVWVRFESNELIVWHLKKFQINLPSVFLSAGHLLDREKPLFRWPLSQPRLDSRDVTQCHVGGHIVSVSTRKNRTHDLLLVVDLHVVAAEEKQENFGAVGLHASPLSNNANINNSGNKDGLELHKWQGLRAAAGDERVLRAAPHKGASPQRRQRQQRHNVQRLNGCQ